MTPVLRCLQFTNHPRGQRKSIPRNGDRSQPEDLRRKIRRRPMKLRQDHLQEPLCKQTTRERVPPVIIRIGCEPRSGIVLVVLRSMTWSLMCRPRRTPGAVDLRIVLSGIDTNQQDLNSVYEKLSLLQTYQILIIRGIIPRNLSQIHSIWIIFFRLIYSRSTRRVSIHHTIIPITRIHTGGGRHI
jgi:hypothetical protein